MKKRLLLIAAMLLFILGFSSKASALNSYAYGLAGSLSDDKTQIEFTYSLNADATSVGITVYNGESPVKGLSFIAGDEIKAGTHMVTMETTDLPKGIDLKWDIAVESAIVGTPTVASKAYRFYHPQGVDVDNDPMSEHFGRILVTECMPVTSTTYQSGTAGDGQGLYAFDPQLNPIKNAAGTFAFKGGQTFEKNLPIGNTAYDPRKVRIAQGGRIFVTRQNSTGSSLYEVDPNDLNAEFTEVFRGVSDAENYKVTTSDGKFITAANVGFDVKGSGDDLKLLMLSTTKGGVQFVYSGFRTDEYSLGNAKTWNTEPSKNIPGLSGKYTITPLNANVIYDNEGGIWYVQYRAAPTAAQPAIVHINAAGEEDYKDITTVAGGAGIRFNPDFTLLAVTNKKAGIGIYKVGKDADNKPTLTLQYEFATTIGTNTNEIAWDSANNLYIVGNSGEWFKVFALPRESGYVTTPAKDIINIPEAKKLYIIGEIEATGYTWKANAGQEMLPTATEDVYEAVVKIAQSETDLGISSFGFATKLGENETDWVTLNSNRYGCDPDGLMVKDNTETPLVKAEGAFKIKGGEYTVVVDMKNMTVKCTNLNPLPYKLQEIAVITEGLPVPDDARQSTLVNGKLYINNKATKEIEIWTSEGKSSISLPGGDATNICHDDYGNIILRKSGFGSTEATSTDLLVYPSGGGDPVEVSLSGLPAGQFDFFGNAKGSVLAVAGDETIGGKLYLLVQGNSNLIEISIKNGQQESIKTYTMPVSANSSAIAYPYGDDVIINISGGSIIKGVVSDHAVDCSYELLTPGHNASNGSSIFTMDFEDYILYPAGGNYLDGYAIAKVSDNVNNTALVEHPETLVAKPNNFQANWLAAEVLSDTRALIYQYTPGGMITVSEFTTADQVYPQQLYAVGSLGDNPANYWDPSDDSYVFAQTENEGEYKGTISVAPTEDGYGFFTLGSTPSADWDIFNANRFGPKAKNAELTKNIYECAITRNGDTSYKVKGNRTYEILVNLKRANILIKEEIISSVEENLQNLDAKVVGGNGEINIIGVANSIEVFTTGGTLISKDQNKVSCPAGIYLVKVDGNVTKVIVK